MRGKKLSKRTFYGTVLIFLLTGWLTLTFNIQRVEASGTIYIRADGSIDPPTANITSLDNVTYTFTDDNYDEIVVERDNIVVDGAGYTVQGTSAYDSRGISLLERRNVTIKNITIRNFTSGIFLQLSSNISTSGNHMVDNDCGIWLEYSSSNSIVGNNITNNEYGIWLWMSSDNNGIVGNNITNNEYGLLLQESSGNNISANIFTNDGLIVVYSYGNVVEDNVVNGKPLVYLEKASDYTVNNAGQVILMNCTNIQVENLTLSHTYTGIQLWWTNNSNIVGNDITNNRYGIRLEYSSSNSIVGNKLTNFKDGIWIHRSSSNSIVGNNITNERYGIWLSMSSDNNGIVGNNITNNKCGIRHDYSSSNRAYYNNFVNNTQHVCTSTDIANIWDYDYPSGGNYWDDYTGDDSYHGPYQNETGSDGIGDTPYIIDGNNRDNYPLMDFARPQRNPCDINHDLTVDMKDIGIAAKAYGSLPGDPLWNPQADITGPEHLIPDGTVDMRDIGLIAIHYGETYF